jgi:hypothetical protein
LPVRYAPYWLWLSKLGVIGKVDLEKWAAILGPFNLYYTGLFSGILGATLRPEQSGFAFGRVAWVCVRNWLLLLVVAAGLHYWFYGIDGQSKLLKSIRIPNSNARTRYSNLATRHGIISTIPWCSARDVCRR